MGRRRRRVVRIVKKKLPTVFVCPRCGEEAVRGIIAKDTGKAVVMCSSCQLKDEFQAHPAAQMIDVYSYFADRFYGVKDPRPIIPRERETHYTVPEPKEEASEPSPETLEEQLVPETPAKPEIAQDIPAESQSSLEGPETTEQASPLPPEPSEEKPDEAEPVEEEAPSEEEAEPFADILQNKDKKRYSPNPLPGQSAEQDTASSS